MSITEFSFLQAVEQLKARSYSSQLDYKAMYSSWIGGIIRDPQLMVVPIDDHGFHRGDAIFEAIKCIGGNIYTLDQHLARLARSASMIGLKVPVSIAELKDIVVQTTRASGLKDALLRLYVSRGPGGFTTNPYEPIGSQIYLVITTLKPISAAKYESGVSVKVSSIGVKEGFFANVKSCNYLANVLMKKEAVDQGVDFTVSCDEKGFIAEGSTENFAIVSKAGEFHVPAFERILRGITMIRMMELAEGAVADGIIKAVKQGPITRQDVVEAREAMFLGTTLDCIAVTKFENQSIGDGRVGPVVKDFLLRLQRDIQSGPHLISI